MLYYNMSYISPFNDMQNLDENNHEFINQNTYKISQYNVVEEDYIVNYGQGSEAEPEHNFLPLNTYIINGLFTNDKQEETEKNKGSLTLPNKPVPNSSGDRRSFNTGFPQEILGVESRKRFEPHSGSVRFTSPTELVVGGVNAPLPIHVKNDVHIHWDSLTHFYFASLTVVSLFIMFRSLQNSH